MMLHQAVINYVDGSKGTTDIEVRGSDYHYHEPFVVINDELILDNVIRSNSKGFLINYDNEILDGWQRIIGEDVESIEVGRYIYRPQIEMTAYFHRRMIEQLERDFA